MKIGWEPVELLHHVRHDWLNWIQLIKTNLALGHTERVNEMMEELTIRSHHESKLSRLHMPRIAEMLLTVNWTDHSFHTYVEVVGNAKDLSSIEAVLLDDLSAYFQHLNEKADWRTENKVKVVFTLTTQEDLLSLFYTGSIAEELPPQHFSFPIIEDIKNENEWNITIKLT